MCFKTLQVCWSPSNGTCECPPFWASTLQEKAPKSNQNRGHLGSRYIYLHTKAYIWMFPKIVVRPDHPILIGFSILFTIHLRGFPTNFGNTHIPFPKKSHMNPRTAIQLKTTANPRRHPPWGSPSVAKQGVAGVHVARFQHKYV